MGWVWKDDEPEELNSSSSGEACSTRKVVRSQCKTEELEPGKFVRKCEKTEEILRECVGRPVEVLKSDKEYTEDDVTDLMRKGSVPMGEFSDKPFDFPGLRSDIKDIERHFLGGLHRFFEAAEDMKSSIFDTFGDFYNSNPSSSYSARRGIPIEGHPEMDTRPTPKESDTGVDFSSLARDI